MENVLLVFYRISMLACSILMLPIFMALLEEVSRIQRYQQKFPHYLAVTTVRMCFCNKKKHLIDTSLYFNIHENNNNTKAF